MKQIELYADKNFEKGFQVHGAKHEDGFVGYILPKKDSPESTDWLMAQWGCKHEILNGERTYGEDIYIANSKSQEVKVDRTEGRIMLELNASKEYTHPRKQGEDWPHLLIAQNNLEERCPTLDSVARMELNLSVRILKCDSHMENPNKDLHCAQTTLYFTVGDLKRENYWWFGVPIFDNRELIRAEYKAADLGKEDCTGKFIYTPAQKEFTDKSFHSNEWITYRKDILPYLKKGIVEAKERGYVESDCVGDYQLTSSNLGWENSGAYDSAMEIKGLSLLCILKDGAE